MEDSRFIDSDIPKKKKIPHQLHWFLDEEYFTDEIVGLYRDEVERLKNIAQHASELYVDFTDRLIRQGALDDFRISPLMQDLIAYSWEHQDRHPFFLGRFDINGVIDGLEGKVIEFNADTCSTLPEALLWQNFQLEYSGISRLRQFNNLEQHIHDFFANRQRFNGEHKHVVIGSSLGYEEDVINVNAVLDVAFKAGMYPVYSDLEHISFAADEGIFFEDNDQAFQADFFFKMFPWDWIERDEPELLEILHSIITQDLCTVLNPAHSYLWQNKMFLAKLSDRYPSDAMIARTLVSEERSLLGDNYVQKPTLGRLGENVKIIKSGGVFEESGGDYGSMTSIFQEYVENARDDEGYSYQPGVFVTEFGPAAINLRSSPTAIVGEECEYHVHTILEPEV